MMRRKGEAGMAAGEKQSDVGLRKGSIDETSPMLREEAVPAERTDTQAQRIVEVLDDYLARLKAGEQPSRQQLLAEHPELAAQLEACLAGIEFIHAGAGGGQPAGKRLGEFRIIREIGHGGMGAVYEAEQISLGRRVALKVLRFGPVSDAEAVSRFQREAETVARLHHTNIVPIFAVGSEGGVNYYAMQYIVGRSLDQVLRDAGKPVAPRTVAEWGLQAAEALAHAHARGVIHRDVKPSNLLIDDEEGRIWLTDFGLAKRLDDVTISMTGALLGTPRYMSPEQARAADRHLDHRTDLYSLGATLYELATYQPVFSGSSPHDVIAQILARDPAAPRSHVPSLPRDLDTIIMKCLAKEPSRRYTSARQLADDLRAFLDGRAIAARRTSPLELAVRWYQRQKKSVALALIAVAATLALVLGSAVGSYGWYRWRMASLMLKTDYPPLVAEVLDLEGKPVATPTSLPTLQPVELPAGDYKLRLSGPLRLSETFDVHLTRGDRLIRKLDLEDSRLWNDLAQAHGCRPVRLAYPPADAETPNYVVAPQETRTDLIRFTEDGIECISGLRCTVRWSVKLRQPDKALLKQGVLVRWPWTAGVPSVYYGVEKFDLRPFVVSETGAAESTTGGSYDFNGDGAGDLLVAAQHQAWIIALSGASGEPLWVAARKDAVASDRSDDAYSRGWPHAAAIDPPLAVGDQDGDGVMDFIAAWMYGSPQGNGVDRWLELVSGATGKVIWRRDLPAELFELPAGEEPPYEFRWFYGSGGGYTSGGSSSGQYGRFYARERSTAQRSGTSAYRPSPLVWIEKSSRVGLVCGRHFVAFDPKSGELTTTDIAHRTRLWPRHADFDADGQTDLLLAETALVQGAEERRLVAWSLSRGELWSARLEADWPGQPTVICPAPAWPICADLDGNGSSEVLVPGTHSQQAGLVPPSGQLIAIDGRTGKRRWTSQLANSHLQVDYFLPGPDIDGDGHREVFAATIWGAYCELYIDCLSGQSGQPMWSASQTLHDPSTVGSQFQLAELAWFSEGDDGWPRLGVVVHQDGGEAPERLSLFSAGTGELMQTAPGITSAAEADFDGDGRLELLVESHRRGDWQQGRLHAFRAPSAQLWRSLIGHQQAAADFDGDQVRDLVSRSFGGPFEVRSGRTGGLLWEATPGNSLRMWQPSMVPAAEHDPRRVLFPQMHDLSGDGTPDLVMFTQTNAQRADPLVSAVSGKTGRLLWESSVRASKAEPTAWTDCRDLDGDGKPEVIVTCATNWTPDAGQKPQDTWLVLFVLSSADGRLKWAAPLTGDPQPGLAPHYDLAHMWLEAAYCDLNADGYVDILLPAQHRPPHPALAMRAFSGHDGQPLWDFPLPSDSDVGHSLGNVPPAAAGDLNGDSRPEVVLLSLADETAGTFLHTHLLHGATGQLIRRAADVSSPMPSPPPNPEAQTSDSPTWKTRADRYSNTIGGQPGQAPGRLRPLLIRRGDGKQWIAVLSVGQSRDLHVLDERGDVVSHVAMAGRPLDSNSRLWPVDIDGDGSEELAYTDEKGLVLRRADNVSANPVWERRGPHQILGVATSGPAEFGRASSDQCLVAAQIDGISRSIVGIDPASGQTRWVTAGPVESATGSYAYGYDLLAAPQATLPPLALYQAGQIAAVRRGVTVGEQQHQPAANRAPAVTAMTEYDPRLLRPLPWIMQHDADTAAAARFFAWTLLYTLTMLAVPFAYLAWLMRARKWDLKTWLVLPVVAGVALMGHLIDGPDNDFQSLAGKLTVSLFLGAPWVFAMYFLANLVWQGRWRFALSWLAAGLLLGCLALLTIRLGLFDASLTAGERWSWEGWYLVFIPSFFLLATPTMWLVLLWWLIVFLWRLVRRNKPSLNGKPQVIV